MTSRSARVILQSCMKAAFTRADLETALIARDIETEFARQIF